MSRSSPPLLSPCAVSDLAAGNTVAVHIEDIHGVRIRLRPATAQLHAAGGHFQKRSRKTHYLHFDEAWLEADRQIFRLVNGFASLHQEGINVVAEAFEEVTAGYVGILAQKCGHQLSGPARRRRRAAIKPK